LVEKDIDVTNGEVRHHSISALHASCLQSIAVA
jgi:hypothetical protein